MTQPQIPEGLLTAAATLPTDPAFRNKVLVAVLFSARQTMMEPGQNLVRLGYARQVLQDPTNYLQSFAWTMAADQEIAAQALADPTAITDALILARVAVTWQGLVRPLGDTPTAG